MFDPQLGEGGKAVGIDHIEELVNSSIANVRKDPELGRLLDSGRLKLKTGDGRMGSYDDGPFDAIHVGAAAREIHVAVSQQY